MYDRTRVQQLYSNTGMGLNRVYQLLSKGNISGISAEDLASFDNLSFSDMPFVELLKNEFTTADKNNDNKITKEEVGKVLSQMQNNGLSYEQMQILASQSTNTAGLSKDLLEKALQNFEKIDENNDGKVSESELKAYLINKEIKEKRDKLTEFTASSISVFYAGAPSATDAAQDSKENNG